MQSEASHHVRNFALLLVAGVLIGVMGLAVCAGSAYAANPTIANASGTQRVVYNPNVTKEGNTVLIKNAVINPDQNHKTTVKNLKSSNTAVLTAKVDAPDGILIQLKRPGQATVTY